MSQVSEQINPQQDTLRLEHTLRITDHDHHIKVESVPRGFLWPKVRIWIDEELIKFLWPIPMRDPTGHWAFPLFFYDKVLVVQFATLQLDGSHVMITAPGHRSAVDTDVGIDIFLEGYSLLGGRRAPRTHRLNKYRHPSWSWGRLFSQLRKGLLPSLLLLGGALLLLTLLVVVVAWNAGIPLW